MTDSNAPSADPVHRLANAEAHAAAARGRLSHTLSILQGRLNPRRLAREARREVTDAGSIAAQRTAETARSNPGALAGLAAVAGLFLARHRIADLLRRRPRHAAAAKPASLPDYTERTRP